MDLLTLPFTTDFSSIAFSVLAILFGCSVIVGIALFMKFFSLIRVKYLQARTLNLNTNNQHVSELRHRVRHMRVRYLQERFAQGDHELRILLISGVESDHDLPRELIDSLERVLQARVWLA